MWSYCLKESYLVVKELKKDHKNELKCIFNIPKVNPIWGQTLILYTCKFTGY